MNDTDLVDAVMEVINNELKQTKVDLETPLATYSIDSFLFIKIVVSLEERFQIEIPDEYLSFDKLDSVKSITQVLEKIMCK